MPESEVRPLDVRLQEYADATRGIVPQLEELAALADKMGGNTQPIRDGIRFYGLVADDLDKLLAGEELKAFRVEGVL